MAVAIAAMPMTAVHAANRPLTSVIRSLSERTTYLACARVRVLIDHIVQRPYNPSSEKTSSAVASGPVSPANYDIMYLTRPLAVEFTVVLEDWGRIVRLLEVPT